METNFNFKSAICTSRSQSERLLALGLKKETADMVYRSYGYIIDEFGNKERRFKQPTMVVEDWESKYDIPAWSLHRLLLLLPKEIRIERNFYTIAVVNDSIQIVDDCGDIYRYFMSMNVYGELIDCIEWIIKEGYFNKEYLV